MVALIVHLAVFTSGVVVGMLLDALRTTWNQP